ncbi:hypothetical protein IW262DRAFT_1302140 [Armillaria fumosa]|nr:hypothetical protein IW262DRAFT_1302140 [Armillaria fumosa]
MANNDIDAYLGLLWSTLHVWDEADVTPQSSSWAAKTCTWGDFFMHAWAMIHTKPIMNTHLLTSNMNPPHELEDWEVLESKIRDWIYILIDLFGIENVGAFMVREMRDPMYERDAMRLAYGGEVLASE